MKARLIRDMERPPATAAEHEALRRGRGYPIVPAGTIHDHPEAWQQVRMGNAIPADEECEVAAAMTPAQLAAAQAAAEKVSRGIHPDDYAAYDAGLMTGYDAAGEWLPGPNFAAAVAEEEYELAD